MPDEDRDRLALRIESLAVAVELAESDGASVIPIRVVRDHLGIRRPDLPPQPSTGRTTR